MDWSPLDAFFINDGPGHGLVLDSSPEFLVLTERGFRHRNPLHFRVKAEPVPGMTPERVYDAMVEAADRAGRAHVLGELTIGVESRTFRLGIGPKGDDRLKPRCEEYLYSPWAHKGVFLLFREEFCGKVGMFSAEEDRVAAVLFSVPFMIGVRS